MIRKVMIATAFAALTLSGPAAAQDTAQRSPEAKAPEEKKICRSEKTTGSLTRVRRICLTEAEWKALHDQTREDISKFQARAGTAE
jgi:hypothetical protein